MKLREVNKTNLWKSEFLTNIEEIDEQHKKFFSMCADLFDYSEREVTDPKDMYALFSLILSFRTYAFYHFSAEEKFMIGKRYPHFLEHMGLHDEYIQKMNELRDAFFELYKKFQNSEGNSEEVSKFVGEFYHYTIDWYSRHIMKADMRYARHLETGRKDASFNIS